MRMHAENRHMRSWIPTLREGLVAGTFASVLSAAALAAFGRRQAGSAAAPINAVSHWLWGDAALRTDRPTLRHTLVGVVVHEIAAVFWAVLHARAWGQRPEAKRPVPAVVGAAAATGIACFVDYQLTPKRLTPGFEHRLNRPAMAGVYACFALGLALGSIAAGRLR
jgi:hypothetical protein